MCIWVFFIVCVLLFKLYVLKLFLVKVPINYSLTSCKYNKNEHLEKRRPIRHRPLKFISRGNDTVPPGHSVTVSGASPTSARASRLATAAPLRTSSRAWLHPEQHHILDFSMSDIWHWQVELKNKMKPRARLLLWKVAGVLLNSWVPRWSRQLTFGRPSFHRQTSCRNNGICRLVRLLGPWLLGIQRGKAGERRPEKETAGEGQTEPLESLFQNARTSAWGGVGSPCSDDTREATSVSLQLPETRPYSLQSRSQFPGLSPLESPGVHSENTAFGSEVCRQAKFPVSCLLSSLWRLDRCCCLGDPCKQSLWKRTDKEQMWSPQSEKQKKAKRKANVGHHVLHWPIGRGLRPGFYRVWLLGMGALRGQWVAQPRKTRVSSLFPGKVCVFRAAFLIWKMCQLNAISPGAPMTIPLSVNFPAKYWPDFF